MKALYFSFFASFILFMVWICWALFHIVNTFDFVYVIGCGIFAMGGALAVWQDLKNEMAL